MNPSANRSTYTNAPFIVATVLVATLALAQSVAFAADKDAHEDRTELRIQDMHTKLKITPAQKEQWAKVADAMLDNAKAMDTLTQSREDHEKGMTAVDDLKSYGEIAEAHADGVKKLTPVFADLYASMSDAQKKEADELFRHGDHESANHKHHHKMSDGK